MVKSPKGLQLFHPKFRSTTEPETSDNLSASQKYKDQEINFQVTQPSVKFRPWMMLNQKHVGISHRKLLSMKVITLFDCKLELVNNGVKPAHTFGLTKSEMPETGYSKNLLEPCVFSAIHKSKKVWTLSKSTLDFVITSSKLRK